VFSGCSVLKSLNLSSFDTNSVKLMNGMFYGCSSLKELDLSNFYTESLENMAFMFYKSKSITSLNISNFNTSNVTQIHFIFDGCESLISLDLSNFETSNIELMDGMFSGCSNLIYLNIDNFNTSNVYSMKNMFSGCKSLISINLSNFDTTLTTSFDSMFSGCKSLRELDINHFNTSSLIFMQYLFSNCSSLRNIDISNFDTSLVINMEYMFSGCKELTSISLTNLNTSLVRYMNNMFEGCSSLKDVSLYEINTSSVIDMSHMFENCLSLISINLSNFNTDNIQTTENMFANDYKLVYVNLQNSYDSEIKRMNNMFLGTLENMVFCINETYSPNLNRIIKRKGCSVIDCSQKWSDSRKLIIAETNECVEKCPTELIFFYDYKCYYRCPNKTLPEEFMCKEPNNETYMIDDEESCSIKKYFLKQCKKKFYSNLSKQKFIEAVIEEFKEGKLYELSLRAVEYEEMFIIREENEIYSIYGLNNKKRVSDLVYIDLDECGQLLRKTYNLKNDLIVFKIEYYSPYIKIPIIEYNLFGQFGIKKLSTSTCKMLNVRYYIPLIIKDYKDYKYNPYNNYYYDKCLPFSSDEHTDLTLYERKNEFNKNNMSLCENNCVFKEYKNNYIQCECDIKIKFNSFLNNNVSKYNLIYRFETKPEKDSNIWVLKCISIIFSLEVITSNLCSQIILGILFFSIISVIIFYAKENGILYKKIKILIEILDIIIRDSNEHFNKKSNKNKQSGKNIVIHKNKKMSFISKRMDFFAKSKEKSSKSNLNSNSNNSKILGNILNNKENYIKNTETFFKNLSVKQKEIINKKFKTFKEKTFNEFNSLPYQDALEQDNRTFCEYYHSFIMTKQLLIFTFSCKNDYNSKIIKLCFLLYIFALFLFMNTIFIDDTILHDIFILKGKINILHFIRHIIYITLIVSFIKNILLQIVFTEDDIISIKDSDEADKRNKISQALSSVTIRCLLFFIFNILSLTFIWIYIACYFTIFKNTQIIVLINTSISFSISLFIPIVFGFIPGTLRWFALLNRQSQNRLYAYYISKILQVFI
jgi:surface protein